MAETFGRELSPQGSSESSVCPPDNNAKLMSTHHHNVECGQRDSLQKDGEISLHRAAKEGNIECLERLLLATPGILGNNILANNILPNKKNNDGWTPLLLAARYGHVGCVKALLRVPGILVNEKNNKGRTSLMLAVLFGHLECVKALLTVPGILVNEKDYHGWTSLRYAARNRQKDCLKLLLYSKGVNMVLLNAVREGQTRVLEEILDTLKTQKEPAKSEAIMQVMNVADQNGKTLLCQAVQFGHEKVVALFLIALKGLPDEKKNRATMAMLSAADRLGRTPLYMAAAFGRANIVSQLLVALHRLAKTEKPWAIAALINAADLFGKTPVSQARSFGHFQIENQLARAFPNAVCTGGTTSDAHTVVVLFNDSLLRLKTLPKETKLNTVMAVLDHAREDVLLDLDVNTLESHHPLVADILAALIKLPEVPEDVSRNDAILQVMDCLCEDGEAGLSYTYVASEGQEQVTVLLKAFPILSAARNGQTAIVARILSILETWPESQRCLAVMTVMRVSEKDWGTGLLMVGQRDQWEVVPHWRKNMNRMSEHESTNPIRKVMHAVNVHGVTPLHWAACRGHYQVVAQLLNAVGRLPATERLKTFTSVVSATDRNGNTALYWAAFEGHEEVVMQFLITLDDFPEAEQIAVFEAMAGVLDTHNRSPLFAAVDNGYEIIVDQLIQAFPLLSAVLGRHNKSVEQFMQALAALPGAARCSAIMAAIKATRADGATPLYIAASQGNIEMIELLLGAVSTLLADGKRQEVRAVLYSACRVEQEGGAIMEISPLRIAASNRHDQAVKLLLEAIRKLFVII
ncbi:ankyrin repeat domain-containing protein [Endozoicomonas sp. SCSIO W0465]|uniref:ankyrin repeat domain-containing protein n=1 Tax=Endozoicomonas sp. SCSIO W0465 TaxID=2918516 RepID=UPI0020750389|nr:ankyrin repeat domain-containing protein [Endozoicomonas sp. SCSIO W0465]USE38499.1 ankyrin repeat domain-containing protein [Endozoicomonas sp. SCSIO W0465]